MPKINPNKNKKRDERIKKQWEDGYLLREIAVLNKITPERVSQILGRPTKQDNDELSTSDV